MGRVGVWRRSDEWDPDVAVRLEELGYGTAWVGGSPEGSLQVADRLLAATERITVGTSIVNMWQDAAGVVAESFHRIEAAHPGRFVLGVGVGHPEAAQEYVRPYDKVVDYLDQLDGAGVPADRRVLAALGPKVLRLAGERCAGAIPYLVTPEHTRWAREILGDGPVLAPEQKVVLDTDAPRAREVGREGVRNPYLSLVNYRRNLIRLGWPEQELDGGGTDRLIDALAVHGAAAAVVEGITAHLEAGADHVAVQALGPSRGQAYEHIAGLLLGA
nr:LLM class F420-dependent oxidoreductase [Saccharopolyspora sp. HNM0983]